MACYQSRADAFKEHYAKCVRGEVSVHVNQETIGNGIILFPGFKKEDVLELQKNLIVRPSDIFVTSYVRSGTNWISYIIQLLVNGGKEPQQDLTGLAVYVESMKLNEVEAMSSPRYMKCHLPYDLVVGGLPHTTPAKYIYSYRNPRDMAISYWHALKVQETVHPPVWEELLDDLITGNVIDGGQLDHIKEWWKHKDAPNILFLSYEEMKKDTVKAIASISTFLGYNYSSQLIEEISFKANIDKMKKNLQSHDSGLITYELVRKGVIGDWKNKFSTEDIAKMDAAVKEKLGDTDIVFDYEDSY